MFAPKRWMKHCRCWRKTKTPKILAGGHSLIPAMKLRLAQPPLLIDIGRISDLAYVREDAGEIRIGAMTTIIKSSPLTC